MQNSWEILLQKLGIAKRYTDAVQNQKEYVVDDETLLKMVNYLGFKLDSIEDSDKLLAKIEKSRWLYALEPIYVVQQENVSFDIVLPKERTNNLSLEVFEKNYFNCVDVEFSQTVLEERSLGKKDYVRINIKINSPLVPQYYEIKLFDGDEHYHSLLAVSPKKCFGGDDEGHKIWGYAIQLYSLKSKRNWGIGDFSDLLSFVKICKQQNADVIGLNPLNVLFHDFPENASPYSSISRLFLNPIYIDVEKVAGFKPQYLNGKAELLETLRQQDIIDYRTVYELKMSVLSQIFDEFSKDKKAEIYKKFMKFCQSKGDDLDNLATYQAIYSSLCHSVYGGWRAWPKELQNHHSSEVKKFAKTHEKEILFFKFLQFWAFIQLDEVEAEIKSCGLKVGLYRDLPVGLCKDSAELWSGNDLFIKDCGAGAPPDAFFPKGQKWCLGAFNPYKLKAHAYEPFIKILRATMANSGAIRIDHVMSLMRLYIIPDCDEDGTYVYYSFQDMLGIVALESYLNKCMVVGESIGNVPDGFIETIQNRGIFSLSVLWSERWRGNGPFKLPQDFPQKAFCSIGTHDMAPLKMRWFGYDIEVMYQLKMISEQERLEQYKAREAERRCLLDALDYTNVWPKDKLRQADCIYGEGYPEGIMEATENYVSSAKSDVFLVQPEDVFGAVVLQNLPGTDRDKHPNWRRKISVELENFLQNDELKRVVEGINKNRN